MALEGRRHRSPSDVQYIHYHGTSTELNDRIETRAVKLAFNGHAHKLAGSIVEEHDRPSAGRLRSGGDRRDAAGHARRRDASDHQRGRSRTRIAIWITCPMSGASCISSTRWPTASRSAARTRRCCCGGCRVGDNRAEERTAMSTGTVVTLSEYLATSYRPDCEYLDGELLERNVGEWDHSRLQMLLSRYLSVRHLSCHVKHFRKVFQRVCRSRRYFST